MARIWDTATGTDIFTYHGHETPPTLQPLDPALHPLPGQVKPVNGQLYQYRSDHSMEVSVVAWSPDGQWIASGGTHDVMRVWHAN